MKNEIGETETDKTKVDETEFDETTYYRWRHQHFRFPESEPTGGRRPRGLESDTSDPFRTLRQTQNDQQDWLDKGSMLLNFFRL
jgi:hypothetical protein